LASTRITEWCLMARPTQGKNQTAVDKRYFV
jgi:hypothetical protein